MLEKQIHIMMQHQLVQGGKNVVNAVFIFEAGALHFLGIALSKLPGRAAIPRLKYLVIIFRIREAASFGNFGDVHIRIKQQFFRTVCPYVTKAIPESTTQLPHKLGNI